MKILITSFTYWPDKNGVQGVTQYQAEGLAKRGHDVTVFTGVNSSEIEEEVYNGVKIRRLPNKTDGMLHFGNKAYYQNLLRDYAKKVDVIMTICPQSWCTDWAIPIIGELPCATIMMVHGIHDFRWNNFKDRSIYGLARKIWGDIRWPQFFMRNWGNINKFDAIAHLHEEDFAAKYFRKHGVKKESILYNAVDDEFFLPASDKKNQIINVGTYTPRKNQIDCLEAFYKSDLSDWQLVLIGSSKNAYYQKLLKYRQILEKKYGHREVDIRVGVSRSETIAEVKKSKIYLLTSISEMFPVSLIEGMAAGCAWVSTEVGINRCLPGGIICDKTDQMASALQQLSLNNYWKDYGKAGRAFAFDNCKKEVQIKKLEQILEGAVQKHQIACENRKLK